MKRGTIIVLIAAGTLTSIGFLGAKTSNISYGAKNLSGYQQIKKPVKTFVTIRQGGSSNTYSSSSSYNYSSGRSNYSGGSSYGK